MPATERRAVPLLTIFCDAADPPQRALAEVLRAAYARDLRVRLVGAARAIGRDVVEAARILLLDWRLPAAMPHLRELLQRSRGRCTVLVGWSATGPLAADAVQALRRHAGRVVCADAGTAADLGAKLLVPVDLVAPPSLVQGVAVALQQTCQDLDAVESHLRESQEWLRRGCDEGAFTSAARALVLAPDQPGIVADTARLLARLGRPREAEHVCRTYLLQRPDSLPVQTALGEVQAAAGR